MASEESGIKALEPLQNVPGFDQFDEAFFSEWVQRIKSASNLSAIAPDLAEDLKYLEALLLSGAPALVTKVRLACREYFTGKRDGSIQVVEDGRRALIDHFIFAISREQTPTFFDRAFPALLTAQSITFSILAQTPKKGLPEERLVTDVLRLSHAISILRDYIEAPSDPYRGFNESIELMHGVCGEIDHEVEEELALRLKADYSSLLFDSQSIETIHAIANRVIEQALGLVEERLRQLLPHLPDGDEFVARIPQIVTRGKEKRFFRSKFESDAIRFFLKGVFYLMGNFEKAREI